MRKRRSDARAARAPDPPTRAPRHVAQPACGMGTGEVHQATGIARRRRFSVSILRSGAAALAELGTDAASGNGSSSGDSPPAFAPEVEPPALLSLGRAGVCVFVRLCFLWTSRTFFEPDEYYQSLEPAHRWVYGEGVLTWEWSRGLRSPLVALPAWLSYAVLNSLRISAPAAVAVAPRITMAALSALGDCMLSVSLERIAGYGNAVRFLFFLYANWFVAFAGARTLVNVFEGAIVSMVWAIALTEYARVRTHNEVAFLRWSDIPRFFPQLRRRCIVCGALAALAAHLRPPSALLTLPALLLLVQVSEKQARRTVLGIRLPIFFAIGIGGAVALSSFWLVDAAFGWTFVPTWWRWIQFNSSMSQLYGAHPWHWYFTNALPSLLALHAVLLAFALYKRCALRLRIEWWCSRMLLSCVAYVLGHSFAPHKELRFMYPVVVLVCAVVGSSARMLAPEIPSQHGSSAHRRQPHHTGKDIARRRFWIVATVFTLINAPAMVLFGRYHQDGVVRAIEEIRQTSELVRGVYVLMPCHLTPGPATIHRKNIAFAFPDCSPTFAADGSASRSNTQSVALLRDPARYIREHLVPQKDLFTHVILTSSLRKKTFDVQRRGDVSELLLQHGYRLQESWRNSPLPLPEERARDIELWTRFPS